MWGKNVIAWAKTRPLLALICVVILTAALSCATAGVRDWFQKRAEIRDLKQAVETEKKENEREKAAWQSVTAAKDAEFAKISRDRDALRKKIAGLQTAQAKPWSAPATDNELLTRFKALGF